MPDPADEFSPAAEPTRRTRLLRSAESQVKTGKVLLGAACALVLAGAAAVSYFGTLAKAAELQRTVRRVDELNQDLVRLDEQRKADHEDIHVVRDEVHRVLDQVNELARWLRVPIVNQSHGAESVTPPKK